MLSGVISSSTPSNLLAISYLLITFFSTISNKSSLKFFDSNVTVAYETNCKELQIFFINESNKLSTYSDYLLVKTLS